MTKSAVREIGALEHVIIETIVMEDDMRKSLIVLKHGDRQVSTKALVRVLGVKSVSAVEPKAAQRLTGYLVGESPPSAPGENSRYTWRNRYSNFRGCT